MTEAGRELLGEPIDPVTKQRFEESYRRLW
jgi:hypothetical protein